MIGDEIEVAVLGAGINSFASLSRRPVHRCEICERIRREQSRFAASSGRNGRRYEWLTAVMQCLQTRRAARCSRCDVETTGRNPDPVLTNCHRCREFSDDRSCTIAEPGAPESAVITVPPGRSDWTFVRAIRANSMLLDIQISATTNREVGVGWAMFVIAFCYTLT